MKPYKTQKRTIVIGGQEFFLKNIRPFFKNVRFYRNISELDMSSLRYVEMIWIQDREISHNSYLTVLNYARIHNIKYKYLDSVSAKKCAEKIISEDMKT